MAQSGWRCDVRLVHTLELVTVSIGFGDGIAPWLQGRKVIILNGNEQEAQEASHGSKI